ncbi:hypothetical protein OG897_17130 [Streptomyces sp. NBC_00237]|uniref:hypothetical protein n=1 Tax=Streptomyces sp. NBC_00237 TaxID=2975687 RepID=UPI00225306A8|nr:hypothetical protein [Streptomyces sp. NBC_00237]MCX5203164.1 hypothetical protein [Streptomyces sp. NBC_00237]
MSNLHLVIIEGSTRGPYLGRGTSPAWTGYEPLTVTHETAQRLVVDLNADGSGLTGRWDGDTLRFDADAGHNGEAFSRAVTPDAHGHYVIPNMWPWEHWDETKEQSSTQRAYAYGATGRAAAQGAPAGERSAWQWGHSDALALGADTTRQAPPALSQLLNVVPDDFDVLFGTGLDGNARVTVNPRCPQAVRVLRDHGLVPGESALDFAVPTGLGSKDVVADAYLDLVLADADAVYLMSTGLPEGVPRHDVTFHLAQYGIVATTSFDPLAKESLELSGFREFDLNYGLREAMYRLPRETERPLGAVVVAYCSLLAHGRSVAVRDLLADPFATPAAPPSRTPGLPRQVSPGTGPRR